MRVSGAPPEREPRAGLIGGWYLFGKENENVY